MEMIKTYWNDVLLVVAAALPLIHPIDPKIYAAIVAAFGVYGIVIKAKAA